MGREFPFVWLLAAFIAYTALMFAVSHFANKNAGKNSFFGTDRKAPWLLVAYGMVGSSISGVTFISVPGNVWVQNFYYMPMVLGFVVGYVIIARVLLPLYYKMNLTSIYTYLGERFGSKSYKTGTTVFMISRVLGAAVRIFVVIVVLFSFLPKAVQSVGVGVFAIVSFVFLLILYLYTYKGGVRTIIWTDAFNTTLMLAVVALTIVSICRDMDWGFKDMVDNIASSGYVSVIDWDWNHGTNFIKQFFSGVFVTIAMTGLDQSMMQKNLACKNIKAAQKNMYTTALIIVAVNFFFLLLGALLCVFTSSHGGFEIMGISKTDEMFPVIASRYFSVGLGIFFLIGLISSSYPSAGAAMTSLTTSFCVDFLHTREEKTRKRVHACVGLVFWVLLVVLYLVSDDAVINIVYKLASYTYGPLLGMFFFGILTRREVKDGATTYVAAASPLICLVMNLLLKHVLGHDMGFSLLLVNGFLTFAGLWLFSKKGEKNDSYCGQRQQ